MTESTANPLILANTIKAWLDKAPDLDVLTFVVVNKSGEFETEIRTYQQLWDNGQRLAAALKAQGLQKGDSFGVVMQNHPEFVDLMVASSILGTIFVPIDPRTKGDKLKYMLDHADCKGAVAANYALSNVEQAWSGRDNWVWSLEAATGYEQSVNQQLLTELPNPEISVQSNDPSAPMQLLYTSGTTGDPKAIMTAHSRFGVGSSVAAIMGITDQDRPYTGLSLTHANAQIVTLGSILFLGLRGVISRKFTKSRLWDITREFGCTWFNLLGGMTTAVFADPRKPNDADNPVRVILSAGMPEEIWTEFEQRFDVKLTEFYGAAEGGLTFNSAGAGPVGSCGKAPPSMELKIFAEDGNECAAGQAGEICFRNADGSSPVVEYFKNPSASTKKTEGGWLRMGDIGHVDENGWLYFHYRMGGGIRKNGDFINTAFVEKTLSKLDEITDVYVYGIESEVLATGEKEVVAAVVLADGKTLNMEKLLTVLKQELDGNSIPDHLQVVAEIPKTASEKPQERFLVDLFNSASAQIISKGDF